MSVSESLCDALRRNAEITEKSIDFMPDPDLAEEAREDADFWRRCASEMEKLTAALIKCAEIAGEDGEAIKAARSGAMTFPTVQAFAIDAVQRLRDDYDGTDEVPVSPETLAHLQEIARLQSCTVRAALEEAIREFEVSR